MIQPGTRTDTPHAGDAELTALRLEVDGVDTAIVNLLARRAEIVGRIARRKQNATAVRCPEREEEVIGRIRSAAQARDLQPDIAERIYRTLISAMCSMQYEIVRSCHKPGKNDHTHAPSCERE